MITHLKGIEFDSKKSQIVFPKLKKSKKVYQIEDANGKFLFAGLRSKRNPETNEHETILFSDSRMQRPSVILKQNELIPIFGLHQVYNSDEVLIGEVEWHGGPFRAIWKLKDTSGRELLLRECIPFFKYPIKILLHLLPIGIDWSAKTGCMELISGGETVTFISREGRWLKPQYRLVNREDLDDKIDEQLLYGALALEIQNR